MDALFAKAPVIHAALDAHMTVNLEDLYFGSTTLGLSEILPARTEQRVRRMGSGSHAPQSD